MTSKRRLGERLLETGVINERQLAEALRAQQVTGEPLGETLVRLGHLDAELLVRMLCEHADVPFLTLEGLQPDAALVARIPAAFARSRLALPLEERGGRLVVAVADPFEPGIVAALERVSRGPVDVVGAPRARLEALLQVVLGSPAGGPAPEAAVPVAVRSSPEVEEGEGSTATQLVDQLLQRGVVLGATDIHIEPTEPGLRVRYRVDGVLQEGVGFPKAVQAALLTRIKIMAGLNIAENRLPQDGRLRLRAEGHDVDLRISTFPTMHGEDVVLRILDRSRVALRLERLGMTAEDITLVREVMRRPHGLVPVTGPTGSGKTTTLYAALAELNTAERSILTLEDPIEYEVPGIRQSQVNVRAGLTFASGLRSLLRHDPDVILVGEMRDEEAVQIALSAALTGHMVLTTLHTNSAAGAIPRLLDMGAEPFVLASALVLVVAQRLVRQLCPACRVEAEVPAATRARYGLGDGPLYRPGGCPACRGTGFRGRLGVFELLPATERIVECVYERRPVEEIQRLSGRPSLLEDGVRKVRAGVTSLDELLRVIAA